MEDANTVEWITDNGKLFLPSPEPREGVTFYHYDLYPDYRLGHYDYPFQASQSVPRNGSDGKRVECMRGKFRSEEEFLIYKECCEEARKMWWYYSQQVNSLNRVKTSDAAGENCKKDGLGKSLAQDFLPMVDKISLQFSEWMVPFDLRRYCQIAEKYQPNLETTRNFPKQEAVMVTGAKEGHEVKYRQKRLAPKKKAQKNKQRKMTHFFNSTQDGTIPMDDKK